MKDKIIVIGCTANGLGVIRSFADKPVDIIYLRYVRNEFAHKSKYIKECHKVPHPRFEEDKFIEFLISNSARWRGAILLDTEDNVSTTLSKHKKELSKYYKVVTADWDQMKIFLEKNYAWDMCLKSGVAHPENYLPKSLDDYKEVRDSIKLPCIFKCVRGHEFIDRFKRKVFEINNHEEYDKYAELCTKENLEIMIQEIIPGPDTNIYKCMTYINSIGEIAGYFFYNKIRQNPPQFGVGRVSVSVQRNEKVENLFKKLLTNSGYRGFCYAEFKKDPRDNQLKFIEINIRMSRMILLPTACGINFPWIIYKDLLHNEQIKFNDYTEGLYWIEINSDILNTIFRHSKEHFSIKEYFEPYFAPQKTFAIFNIKDIKPYIAHTFGLPMKSLQFLRKP
jgi:predicted ATP-grasp superfamily ATP-dependent carboligase